MKSSEAAITLIKISEGFRPTKYLCPAGKLTIGYGFTEAVLPNIKAYLSMTEKEADALLRIIIAKTDTKIGTVLKIPVPQGVWDACADFVFNFGIGAFASSTFARCINEGKFEAAANELITETAGKLKGWIFSRNAKGEMEVLPGLVTRRRAAKQMILKEIKHV